jgi:PAS domain S-box-containing protein
MFGGFLLGLLTLVGSALLLTRSVIEFRGERVAGRAARSDLNALNAFLATLEDAETGQRGYLLTGDTAYLIPYRAAVQAIGTHLAAIEQSADNDSQRVWARALRPHVTAKLAELAETIALRKRSEADALAVVRTGDGQREMSEIRAIVRELSQADALRLDALIHASDATLQRLTWHLAITIAIQFVLAGLLFIFLRREHAVRAFLAASEERFRRLSDGSTDGVIISRDGIIVDANAAFCRMFAGTEASLVGESVAGLVDEHDRDAVMHCIRENVMASYDLTCLRLNGTTFEGQVTGRPITYHGAPARISILRDITEWSRVSRLKSEFVSTVSHELRTPLTSIHGALRLMEGGAMGALAPAMANLVTIGRTNCERLIRLINDMLDLDKIEAGKLELRCTVLAPADLVQTTLDGMRAMADGYRVRLDATVDAPRAFNGDRDRLLQVLTNLVSNAVKFAPTDSTVMVTARTTAFTDTVRFAVTNGGPGIAPSDMGRLFSRFQQIDGSDARRRGGTGLGLTIAKAIVEQHGGSIGAESTPHVATTFWFELPIAVTISSVGSPDIVLTH